MMMLAIRTKAVVAALGLMAVGLGGCGFTPLYGAPGVTPKLAAIEVSRPDGRTGYLMGQDLDDAFGKEARTGPPLYRLLLKTREVRIPRGVRVNNVASRYEVQVSTTYTLVNIATRAIETNGKVDVSVTYDSADQPYAGIAAASDGEARAAEQVAERIRLELALYFAHPQTTTVAAANSANGANDVSLTTFSERLQPATVESPRERALGQPSSQSADPSILGRPLQSTTPDGVPPATSPYTAPNDPPGASPPAGAQ
jgi:LPS-assembly lipoprotein